MFVSKWAGIEQKRHIRYMPLYSAFTYLRRLARETVEKWNYDRAYTKKPIYRSELQKTGALCGAFNGHSAFVLANGPSLRKLDMEKVAHYQKKHGFKVFCVNSYINGEFASIVRPDYYCLSDPAFLEGDSNITDERKEEIAHGLQLLVQFKIPVFLPINFLMQSTHFVFPKYYFYDFEYRWFKSGISLTGPRAYLSMTAYKALAAAVFLGFEKIYICGMDNDYFKSVEVDSLNQISYLNMHASLQKDSGKHFVPRSEAENIGHFLYEMSFMFSDLVQFPGDRIINLDPASLVDVFSKDHHLNVYRE